MAEHALKELFVKAQIAIDGLYQNIFGCCGKWILFPFAMWSRLNAFACPANDRLDHLVVKNLVKNGEFRDNLTDGIYVSTDKNDNLGRLENAMKLHEKAQVVSEKIKAGIKAKTLPHRRVEDLVEAAHTKSVITLEEKHIMQDALSAVLDAMQVDEYSLEEYKKI